MPEDEEDEMDENSESITDVSVLGAHLMSSDKSQKHKLLVKVKNKLPAELKRKLPQEANTAAPRKYYIKEAKTVEQGVHLIQATTINANSILNTNQQQVRIWCVPNDHRSSSVSWVISGL